MIYNLLEENWIPVLYLDGQWGRVGIRKALEDAGRIRQIAASNPMDRVALLRFLLAVLYWCRGNPTGLEEKDRILAEGRFPANWFGKLEERRECFNLLGEGKRFCQNEAYKHFTAEHTTDYLIHEVPSGTNKWHFRHATDGADGLCPACCAMGLIRLPVFATSAGRGMKPSTGKSPGINSKPPLYILPVGKSLAATLLLLWQPTQLELGTPGWETPGDKLPQKGEVPLLTGMTWLPRSVWLGDPERPESICASCGRQELLIRLCVFDGKGSMKTEGRVWRDPHLVYEAATDGKATALQTSNALGASDTAAGHWARRMAGILRARQPGGDGLLWIVGFSTVQNDKYLEASEYLVPGCSWSQQEQELVTLLEQWEKEGAILGRQVRPRASKRKHVEIRPAIDSVRPHVEAKVSARADELLGGGRVAWERVAREYSPLMEVIAKSLAPGFTTESLLRHNEIAQALPRMTAQPTTKSRKPRAKKEGEQ